MCKEHAELRCLSYPHCCGCNSFTNPTNFEEIKYNISKMNMEEFIDFCGGDSCENVICKEIPVKYAHCNIKRLDKRPCDCAECIREYLERKTD